MMLHFILFINGRERVHVEELLFSSTADLTVLVEPVIGLMYNYVYTTCIFCNCSKHFQVQMQ